jgi:hypothetical protein
MRRFGAPVFFLTLILVLFGLASAALALPQFDRVLINNNTRIDRYSLNQQGDLAYLGWDANGVPQIFLWRQGATVQITNYSVWFSHSLIESVQLNNRGQIVWTILQTDEIGSNRNVYLYDGITVKQLNDNQGKYGYTNINPSLNNQGQVAWVGGPHIYLYSDDNVTQITSHATFVDNYPVLNDLGTIIWWRRDPEWWGTQILFYNGAGVLPLTGWDRYDWQSINNRGWMMYNHWDLANNTKNIYLVDPDTGNATKITNNEGATNFNSPPTFLNNDNQVLGAWSKAPNQFNDIYLYSLTGVTEITFDENIPGLYNLADGGWVAYTKPAGVGGNLLVYHGGERLVLYPAQYNGARPRINSRGQVAWQVGGAPDVYKMYLSTPRGSLPGVGMLLLN